MIFKSSATYRTYASIYDSFKGDRSATVQFAVSLIARYNPQATTLLDLACGTGAIAEGLADNFTIVGVDKSPHMLRVARQKLPKVQFKRADMTTVKLKRFFDVAICLHNSVNHLLSLKQWDQFFANVAAHLSQGGIFIFDINPLEKLEKMSLEAPRSMQLGGNFITTSVTKNQKHGHYDWHVRVSLNHRYARNKTRHEIMKVTAFSHHHITELLCKYFNVLQVFTPQDANHDDIERVYYVCRLKAELADTQTVISSLL